MLSRRRLPCSAWHEGKLLEKIGGVGLADVGYVIAYQCWISCRLSSGVLATDPSSTKHTVLVVLAADFISEIGRRSVLFMKPKIETAWFQAST